MAERWQNGRAMAERWYCRPGETCSSIPFLNDSLRRCGRLQFLWLVETTLGKAGCGAIVSLLPYAKELRQLYLGDVSSISMKCRDDIEMARRQAPRPIEVTAW